jgi:hypothetical protein
MDGSKREPKGEFGGGGARHGISLRFQARTEITHAVREAAGSDGGLDGGNGCLQPHLPLLSPDSLDDVVCERWGYVLGL